MDRSKKLQPSDLQLGVIDLLRQLYANDGANLDRESYYADEYLFPTQVSHHQLLDVGGAIGNVGLYMRIARGARVDILDEYEGHGSDALNHRRLEKRLDQLGVSDMRIMQGDVRNIDIPPATYNSIYMRNTLHHIFDNKHATDKDIVATMIRFNDWLSPKGSLLIGEVGWLMAWRLVPPIRNRFFKGMDYRSKSSFRRWRDCAEAAGFVFAGVKWYVPYKFRRWRRLLGNEYLNMFLTGSYVLKMIKP